MKQVIDAETGEIIEVEESNEIATKKLYEVGAINEDTADFIEEYLTIKEKFEMFQYILKKAMVENNIKTWSNDLFTASIRSEGMQTRVDIERLKEDGLYDKYLKLIPVKESISIRFKGRKNER